MAGTRIIRAFECQTAGSISLRRHGTDAVVEAALSISPAYRPARGGPPRTRRHHEPPRSIGLTLGQSLHLAILDSGCRRPSGMGSDSLGALRSPPEFAEKQGNTGVSTGPLIRSCIRQGLFPLIAHLGSCGGWPPTLFWGPSQDRPGAPVGNLPRAAVIRRRPRDRLAGRFSRPRETAWCVVNRSTSAYGSGLEGPAGDVPQTRHGARNPHQGFGSLRVSPSPRPPGSRRSSSSGTETSSEIHLDRGSRSRRSRTKASPSSLSRLPSVGRHWSDSRRWALNLPGSTFPFPLKAIEDAATKLSPLRVHLVQQLLQSVIRLQLGLTDLVVRGRVLAVGTGRRIVPRGGRADRRGDRAASRLRPAAACCVRFLRSGPWPRAFSGRPDDRSKKRSGPAPRSSSCRSSWCPSWPAVGLATLVRR